MPQTLLHWRWAQRCACQVSKPMASCSKMDPTCRPACMRWSGNWRTSGTALPESAGPSLRQGATCCHGAQAGRTPTQSSAPIACCRCRRCWKPPAVRCGTCSISQHTCPPTCQHLSQAASRGPAEQMQPMLCHSLRCLRAKRTATLICQPLRPQKRGSVRRLPEGQAARCTLSEAQRCPHDVHQLGAVCRQHLSTSTVSERLGTHVLHVFVVPAGMFLRAS